MEIMPEIAMFRRFGALNARSLLYYQNELAHLEEQLKELEAEDAKSPDGKKATYSMNAFWLNTADFEVNGELRDGDMRQRELVLQIRRVLKEYSMGSPIEEGSGLLTYCRRCTYSTSHHTPNHERARSFRPRPHPEVHRRRRNEERRFHWARS